jgi:heme exporter protein D
MTASEFVSMGGYGLYVWGSLGMCAAVVVAELMVIRFRRRLLVEEAGDERATQEHAA